MHFSTKTLTALAFCAVTTLVHADTRLTVAQCNDYPFKQPVGEVTHAQLMQELAELESVGYNPTDDNINYPDDIQQAEANLQKKYQRDCVTPNRADTAALTRATQ